MATSLSSSSIILQAKYDVFLSFRGKDTRDNFTSHLYASLCQKQIQTFVDDDGLNRGDEISPALLKAIEESKISVIIFSEHYASSKWCLDELVKILECKEKNGQMVMPVFYHVNPSDVRKQTGSFKDAFVKHEKIFKKTPEKVQRWRAALIEASNLCGWDSMVIRPESKLVDVIVKEILKKLNDTSSSNDCEDLVGIDSCIDHIKSLLCTGLSDFRIIGILGMGGIGKTTIVGAVFNQISNKFESSCFIANVREESKKHGLVYLRNQLLSQLLEEENVTIGTPIIPNYVKKRVQCKKVFIVLDDINDIEQLEFLIRGIGRLGSGSRVIITTRDKQVICNYRVDNMYEIEGLKYHEALQLFSSYAFKDKNPPKDFLELSDKVVDYAKGNPLALKVMGSSLYLKSIQDWDSVLHKLQSIPNPKIYNVLKISYDELDREEQNIFLDIACFFKGEDNDSTITILNSCYYSAYVGLRTLIDKSIIARSANNKLEMHDLLQEMGREIVRQESLKEPGKRSRLWNHDDVFYVLKNNTGTDVVEGLFLDMSKIPSLHLCSKAFENMPNLKFLKFYVPSQQVAKFINISTVHLPQGLKYLSNELRYLHWHGYPLKTLPANFNSKNLIELQLPYSNVDEQLFIEKQICYSLLKAAREREHYQRYPYIPPSIQYLSNLCILNLCGCESLRSFPSNLHFRCLVTLNLAYCTNLSKFPQVSGNIRVLSLSGTAIDEVPASIACLTKLDTLTLWNCKRLKSISTSIHKLKSLHRLSLCGYRISKSQLSSYIACWKELKHLWLGFCNITEIPDDICCLSSLEFLDLSGNKFGSLPTSVKQLSQLRRLYLYDCNMLQSIPELPLALKYLDACNCGRLLSIADPPLNQEELGESELAIVSGSCYPSSSLRMQFIFTNCLKLNHNADNNILTNSHQRIQHMATLALRLFNTKVFDKIPEISLCLPGSDIPEWFSHQSLGSSISFELPQHLCNRRLIGFALSAVLAFHKSYDDHIKVICRYDYGNSVKFEWSCFVGYAESDHIVLGYTPCIDLKGHYRTTRIASFEFSLYNYSKKGVEAGFKLKCCGVYPLYVQPNKNRKKKVRRERRFNELYGANTSGSGNGNGNGTSNEVEVEANANTYCPSCWSLLMTIGTWMVGDFVHLAKGNAPGVINEVGDLLLLRLIEKFSKFFGSLL